MLYRRLFDLRPGEGRKTVLFALLALIWAIAASCGLTLSDGFFVDYVGADQLPRAYLFMGLAMIGGASLMLFLLSRFNIFHVFLLTLTFGAAGYLFLALFLRGPPFNHSLLYIFNIWGTALYTILITSYWSFLDQYFDMQDAKRLYTLFNSAILTGTAFGGLAIRYLLPLLALPGLLVFVAATLLLSLLLAWLMGNLMEPVCDDTVDDRFSREGHPTSYVIRSLLTSPFTLLFMALSLLYQLAVTFTEFHFWSTFEDSFAAAGTLGENQLTLFMGELKAWIAVGNLIFGLFFYSRMIRRIGVSNAAVISPICFLGAYSCWTVGGGFWIAILAVVITEGIYLIIDDNTFNLLLNAVPPRIKYTVRVTIENFMEPLGIFLAALLLQIPAFQKPGEGLLIAAVLLGTALLMRAKYPKALFANLQGSTLHFEKSTRQWLGRLSREQEVQSLRRLFQAVDEQNLNGVQGVMGLEVPRLFPLLLKKVEGWPWEKKLLVLEEVFSGPFGEHPLFTEAFANWEKDEPRLEKPLRMYGEDPNLLFPFLESQNLFERRAAAIGIARKMREGDKIFVTPLLAVLHRGEDERVQTFCLQALGKIGDRKGLWGLVERSAHFTAREKKVAEAALKARGIRNFPLLCDLLRSQKIHPKGRVLAAKALRKLQPRALKRILERIFHRELQVAEGYLHGSIHQEDSLLRQLCRSAFHQQLGFLLQVCSLEGGLDQCEILASTLNSPNEKIQSQAIETLEQVCHRPYYLCLLPLLQEISTAPSELSPEQLREQLRESPLFSDYREVLA